MLYILIFPALLLLALFQLCCWAIRKLWAWSRPKELYHD